MNPYHSGYGCKGEPSIVKPVATFTIDGDPDENPRYQKFLDNAIQHFAKHNLVGLFIATNAHGRNAFN